VLRNEREGVCRNEEDHGFGRLSAQQLQASALRFVPGADPGGASVPSLAHSHR